MGGTVTWNAPGAITAVELYAVYLASSSGGTDEKWVGTSPVGTNSFVLPAGTEMSVLPGGRSRNFVMVYTRNRGGAQ